MDWPLLEPLSEEERRDLFRRARRRRFSKGEVLFHEGDPGDTMHLLAKGHIAIRVSTPLGDIATLQVLRPGEHFGEMAVVSGAPRNATVVALEDVETVSIHRDVLEQLRHEHRAIDQVLLHAVMAEVRRLSRIAVEAMYVPVEKRTWRQLLHLTATYGSGSTPATTIPLTQEDIAGLIGTTRPTVNRLLRGAEDAGLLKVARGRVEILDHLALERRAR